MPSALHRSLALAARSVPAWCGVDPSTISVTRHGDGTAASGMTNALYLVASDCGRCIARVVNLAAGVDRVREARLLAHVSAHAGDLGVRVLSTVRVRVSGRELLVRFEDYLHGRTLTRADIRSLRLAPSFARVLARFHALQQRVALEPPPVAAALPRQLAHFVDDIAAIAAAIRIPTSPLHTSAEWASLLAIDWAREAAAVNGAMAAMGGPLVLAHCDAQPGNWIEERPLPSSDGSVFPRPLALWLIDLEYASYQQRGFDLGNLCCELCSDYTIPTSPGFTWDSMCFPSPLWQRTFAEAYADAAVAHEGGGGVERPSELPPFPTSAHASSGASGAADVPAASPEEAIERMSCAPQALERASSSTTVRTLLREARVGALASHFFWACWAVVLGAAAEGAWSPPAARLEQACEEALLAAAGGDPARVCTIEVEEGEGGAPEESPPPSPTSAFSYRTYAEVRIQQYFACKGALHLHEAACTSV